MKHLKDHLSKTAFSPCYSTDRLDAQNTILPQPEDSNDCEAARVVDKVGDWLKIYDIHATFK
ncbi:MAG: hypothetical protein ABSB22_15485 [Thermodesulfobacteriota bacterium]|jgi:hypothetical protein